MSPDSLISIVIVGYNAGRFLRPCLDSIYAQTHKDYEVIFVNNGSIDDTLITARLYPNIAIIDNNKNMGFCYANNQGIRVAKGKYILALNADIILKKDFLKNMIGVAVRDGAGLFGSKILTIDRKRIGSTGLMLSRFYRFFDRGRDELDAGQYDNSLDIFGPCAAAALYKREMLEDVKYNGEYFDNDFFFLGEDFDLAWRARNRNWKARFVPEAVCYHVGNSTDFNRDLRQYLSFRNRAYLLIKNAEPGIRYVLVILLYDLPRLIHMCFTNRYTFRALREITKNMPRMLRKRYAHT